MACISAVLSENWLWVPVEGVADYIIKMKYKWGRRQKREGGGRSAGTHLDGLVVRNEKRLEFIAHMPLGGTRQQLAANVPMQSPTIFVHERRSPQIHMPPDLSFYNTKTVLVQRRSFFLREKKTH